MLFPFLRVTFSILYYNENQPSVKAGTNNAIDFEVLSITMSLQKISKRLVLPIFHKLNTRFKLLKAVIVRFLIRKKRTKQVLTKFYTKVGALLCGKGVNENSIQMNCGILSEVSDNET